MAIIQNATTSDILTIDPTSKAALSSLSQNPASISIASQTGTMAAALTANSKVFLLKRSLVMPDLQVTIKRIQLRWTCIVAFTTPVTARNLVIQKQSATSVTPSGGTALSSSNSINRSLNDWFSPVSSALFTPEHGGDVRISTTAALTAATTAVTSQIGVMRATNFGTAGATFTYDLPCNIPLEVGEMLFVANGTGAMDAAGTWQLAVNIQADVQPNQYIYIKGKA